LLGLKPDIVIQADKELDSVKIPGKPQVSGDFLQGLQRSGKFWFYSICRYIHRIRVCPIERNVKVQRDRPLKKPVWGTDPVWFGDRPLKS